MASNNCSRHVLLRLIGSFLISGCLLFSTLPTISQSQITLDGSLGPRGPLAGPTYTIPAEVGQMRGANLFHSFGQFNVQTGESATFTGPNTINNILSRVTGGQRSVINGLLRSEIPGANLFLLNPSGVLFGPNATLEVGGSFHVSTADYVRLADGAHFVANLSADSVLSVAPPVAFGFLGPQPPATITIEQSALRVPEGETLSVVGGDIEIVGNALAGPPTRNLEAPGGRITIASVASAGEVIPSAPGAPPGLQVASFERLGAIALSQRAFVDAGGDGGGTVVIRGGVLRLDDALLFASTRGPIDSLLVGSPGAGIDIEVRGEVFLDNGAVIGTNVFGGVAEDSGGVRIRANHVEVSNRADIQSVALVGSAGDSGNIEITTQSLLVRDGGVIRANTAGTGNSGDIIVRARSLEVRDGGALFSLAFAGSGNGGNIDVRAERVLLSNANAPDSLTAITTQTETTGKAGDIRVTAGSLQILENTAISTPTFGPGQGGNIEVTAEGRVFISGSSDPNVFTGLFANTFGSGSGGHLRLTAGSLEMTSRASLQAGTFGAGDAGGATVTITGNLELRDASRIFTSALQGTGNAADLNITAQNIFISGINNSTDLLSDADFTGLSVATNAGRGGNLHLKAENLHMTNNGLISASSVGAGDAGTVSIQLTKSLHITNGGSILAVANGAGRGGDIEVMAESVVLSGVSSRPIVDASGRELLRPSGIVTQTLTGGGNAGDVRVTAKSVQVLDGARIDASTAGAGDAGNIDVTADSMVVSGANARQKEFATSLLTPRSSIQTSAESLILGDAATGNAGDIRIQAGELQLLDAGLINSETTGPGTGGDIDIVANRLTMDGDARVIAVSTVSPNAGKAGDITIRVRDTFQSNNSIVSTAAEEAESGTITIEAHRVQLNGGTFVSVRSFGAGNAGILTITATDTFLSKDSTVTTTAEQAGGGDIVVAARLVQMTDSNLTAAAMGPIPGEGSDGGNVTIQAEQVILNRSDVLANAFGGNGGNISINATGVFLADAETCPAGSCLDVSSQLGIAGAVEVSAPVTEVSGTLAPLPETFARAAALLRDQCAERLRGGQVSSFVVAGRDGIPVEPGGVLPSPPFQQGNTGTPLSEDGQRQGRTPTNGVRPQHVDARDGVHTRREYTPRFSRVVLDAECGRRFGERRK